MSAVALIGLDWGTSTLRAYGIDREGQVLDSLERPAGIMAVAGGDFENILRQALACWPDLGPETPVLASGMITSQQGWVETPYLHCPAGAAELSAGLTRLELPSTGQIWFVAGLQYKHPAGVYDVMRGEETQIVGCLADNAESEWFVLPGTHVKWARVKGGQITGFATFMTGEVFAALRDHTILGRLMRGRRASEKGFDMGLQYGLSGDVEMGGLLRRLFSVRTHGLFGKLASEDLHDYLSGLLIGCEIREALAGMGAGSLDGGVTLVGRGALVDRYEQALARAGYRTLRASESVVGRGHWLLARKAGLIE